MKTYKTGISLIVLVITVIVLSILAATVIISLSNTNIIQQASNAVDKSNLQSYNEQVALAYASWVMDNPGELLTDVNELETYGFNSDDLPSGIVATIENGVVKLIEVSIWDGTSVATSFARGTGTYSDPYIIESASEFAYLASYVNSGNSMEGQYIKLNANIDLGGHSWTPIGTNSTNYFAGHFDGGNNTIFNINVNVASNAGLFGYGTVCSLQNVVLSGGSVTATNRSAGALIGTLCNTGRSSYKTITNVVNNNVSVTAQYNAAGIAGIVTTSDQPWAGSDGLFSVVNYGEVKATKGSAAAFANFDSWMVVQDSVNYGKIEGANVKVFASYEDNMSVTAIIKNNINYGDITATGSVGFIGIGVTAEVSDGYITVSNNYNYGNVTVGDSGTICWYGIENAPST